MTTNVTIPQLNLNSAVTIANGTGSSGLSYTNTWASVTEIKPSAIHVNGDAVFQGNIEWQGRDMREWFARVEARLGMLQTNPKMEVDWDELKALGDQYRALEQKLLEQQRVFDILKK